ncbi:MAG: histidine--tRNA ligase [Gammaproteobacteria bacterium]|nr:histidine--tRNA ligase [Gammaproteobacteria bacterium]
MADKIQAVRGMHDILPDQINYWQYLESVLNRLLSSYGYLELRLPIVEKTALFKRSIGEVTDIVEKEMYTFDDRNGDSLTLRPEGTAGCLRACLEHGLLHNQQLRLWYHGQMFRHERPQKGRYRQFYQVGVEAYGMAGPDIDIELIALSHRLWQELGVRDVVQLELNTLGTAQERLLYRDKLVTYFDQHRDHLDQDSLDRLERNPLRILDSKNPDLAELISAAPTFSECLQDESMAHFQHLQSGLGDLGIAYVLNPHLVRGLDYYCNTVFEWTTTQLGAQGTICAGGRYDGLVTQLGGRPVPAIGFAMGLERIILLIQEVAAEQMPANVPHVYMIRLGEMGEQFGLQLSERLRSALPELRLILNCGGGSAKSQFKRADKSGAQFALIIGEDEVNKLEFGLKTLRKDQQQQNLSEQAVIDFLKQTI